MSLLEEAKKQPTKAGKSYINNPTEEEIELCLAYLKGELTARQTASALNMVTLANVRFWSATILKKAHSARLINLDDLCRAPGASETKENTESGT